LCVCLVCAAPPVEREAAGSGSQAAAASSESAAGSGRRLQLQGGRPGLRPLSRPLIRSTRGCVGELGEVRLIVCPVCVSAPPVSFYRCLFPERHVSCERSRRGSNPRTNLDRPSRVANGVPPEWRIQEALVPRHQRHASAGRRRAHAARGRDRGRRGAADRDVRHGRARASSGGEFRRRHHRA
jgi:hypothetical protein